MSVAPRLSRGGKESANHGIDYTCPLCSPMFTLEGLKALQSREGYLRKDGREPCSKCSRNGCIVCKEILKQESWHKWDGLRFFTDGGLFAIKPTIPYYSRWETIEWNFFADKDDPAAAYGLLPPLEYLAGRKAISAMKKWLSECQCRHKGMSQLPTRILDVGANHFGKSIKLRIRTKSPYPENADYVALSYCWGGSQPIVATIASLPKLEAGISIEELPQTIRDAVEVTRKLGFRFLWVDSLCIIQDSESDKAFEISQMGSVYTNAFVTLAASSAHSVTEGFLRSSVSLDYSTVPISIASRFRASRTGKLSICKKEIKKGKLPLDQRGWSFQEFVLSPRIIQFWNGDLVWTCNEDKMRRVQGLAFDYDVPIRYGNTELNNLRLEIHANSMLGDVDRCTNWTRIVCDYTARKLSDKNDRLNAIAGVATRLETKWGDEYLYGLWKSKMIRQLTWVIAANYGLEQRPLERSMVAPSWSWASVNSRVDYSRFGLTQDAISLGMDLSSNYPHGEHSRRLRLSARLLQKLKLVADTRYTYYFHTDVESDDLIADEAIELLYMGQDSPIRDEYNYKHVREEYIGLLVTRIEEDCFRRIGWFQMLEEDYDTYQGKEKWEAITRQQLVLI